MTNVKRVFKVDGKPFYPLGGQASCRFAYNDADFESAFKAVKMLHGNTLSTGVYWECIAPEEGKFDFTMVDDLIASAHRYGVKLILDWFATWKCGNMDYAPGWVKTNPERFKRVISPTGMALWVLSSHCQANFEADKEAFVALCKHLKTKDTDHIVIGIQVENESGIIGSDRDYGPEGQAEFDSPVPAKLMASMKAAGKGKVYDLWQKAGGKKSGTWPEVFGWSAGELMSAWSLAVYHDGLAKAGKAIYDIPMFVNFYGMIARQHLTWEPTGVPGNYPSGGAVVKVLDIYKWFTPHVDMICTDIYWASPARYEAECAFYARDDNPLFMPEAASTPPPELFRAIADYNLIGYFGMGWTESIVADDGSVRPDSQTRVDMIRCVASAIPLLLKYQGTGKIHAVVQEGFGGGQELDLDGYLGRVQFGDEHTFITSRDWRHKSKEPLPGDRPGTPINRAYGLVIQASRNEFYLVGSNYQLFLYPKLAPDKMLDALFISDDWQYTMNHHVLTADEGHFDEKGEFVVDRRRNGSPICSGIWVENDTGVVRVMMCD